MCELGRVFGLTRPSSLVIHMQVNYWPSTLDDVQTSPDSKEAQAVSSARIEGQRVKQVSSLEL